MFFSRPCGQIRTLWLLSSYNNNNILIGHSLPKRRFLGPSGNKWWKKYSVNKRNMVQIPSGRRQTIWLFIDVANDLQLNSEHRWQPPPDPDRSISLCACTHLTENFKNECFEPLWRIELVARTLTGLKPWTSGFQVTRPWCSRRVWSIMLRANFDASKHIHDIDTLY